ncbi:MAG TPA: ribonuclease HII [Desulfurivibrionaceae bacterium]|nr:ribonuclease HII [Desulfurivibrionaceae bacterium]
MKKSPTLFSETGFVESDTFAFERALFRQGFALVAGTDEAGRGPLAGPVVAGAVILPRDCDFTIFRDSKQLSHQVRAELFEHLRENGAVVGVGICEVEEIDRLNILRASLLAMQKAMHALAVPPDFLLVDGKFAVPALLPQKSLVKGDCRSASIAAASIVAKEVRDRLMVDYHHRYPQYNFAGHKGYPTAEHRRLLKEHGPCAIHRRTFKGVQEFPELSDE